MGAATAARRPAAAEDPDYPEILRAVEDKIQSNGETLDLGKITLGVTERVRGKIRVLLYGGELDLDVTELEEPLRINNIATIEHGDEGLGFGFRNSGNAGEMKVGETVVRMDGQEVQINNLQNFVREVLQALLVEFFQAGLELERHPQQELNALVERVTRPGAREPERTRLGLLLA